MGRFSFGVSELFSTVTSVGCSEKEAEPVADEPWLSSCSMRVAIGTRFYLSAQTTSCMINVNCPFCMDDFFPPAELALVAFDVAGDPVSCNG